MIQQGPTRRNFHPSIFSCSSLLHALSVRNITSNARDCMRQQTFHYELFCRKFHPSNKTYQALDVGLNCFSKSGILSHISHTSYLEDSHDDLIIVESPKPLLLNRGDDDLVEADMGLSHEIYCNNDVYTNLIQAFIVVHAIFGMSLIMHMVSCSIPAKVSWTF